MNNVYVVTLLLALSGCAQKEYYDEKVNNPAFKENTVFVSYENMALPKFDSLKAKYQLDTIFHGEQDEFKRILLLRNWIRKVISINDYCEKYPGDGSVNGILDAALKGQGFHCGHFMLVQNAIMNAYGYVTRCLGSGPGVKGGPDGHHGFNEIWVNKYHKWFLSDAKYDHHFEKNGVTLSALEVRDEYLKNQAKDIVLVKGPDRMPIELDEVADKDGRMVKYTRAEVAQWFTWLEWDKRNDRFSAGPGFSSKLNMYRDDYVKNNIWIWDGKPHWAYNTDYLNYIDSRDAIEWTPNTIKGDVVITGKNASIKLASLTPNFKEYQMKDHSSDSWNKCDSVVNIKLTAKRDTITFRSVNTANVPGPEYKVVIASK